MDGLIGIIKPTGMYSGKVLGKIKSILWQKIHPTGKKLEGEPKLYKVGHMGTLDPDAEGILVVGIGKALKGFNDFLNKEKTYETIFKFGIETDTLDHTGNIVKSDNFRIKDNDDFLVKLECAVKEMIGEQLQIPPLVSAVHFNGVRGYNLARQHSLNIQTTENDFLNENNDIQKLKAAEEFIKETEELLKQKAKSVTIFSFKLLRQVSNNEFEFEITCSSGTYIRAIARDLAKKLSTLAITTKINRTKCGVFNYSNSVKFEDLDFESLSNNLQ